MTELIQMVDSDGSADGKADADQDIVDNFQPQQLCTQVKIMKALEDDTDFKLKTLKVGMRLFNR